MSINAEIHDQAYRFFVEEAPELLQVIEAGLLKLRQEHSTAQVHELMRAAHSIKGGAASVGLEEIKLIAHRLEDFFKALYSQEVEIDTELEGLLLQAYDCLRLPLTEQIEQGGFNGEQALSKAEPIFSHIEEQLGDALAQADNYIPSSADLGIDVVSSIFEVDVAQGLEQLAAILEQPQNYEVAGEVQAQAEVFAGFGELLNLSGFEEIAKMVLRGIDKHPEQALTIAQLAFDDFSSARELVLAGDRTQGGSPSSALVAVVEAESETLEPVVAKAEDLLADFAAAPETLESVVAKAEDLFADFAAAPETLEPVVAKAEDLFADFAAAPETLEPAVEDLETSIANIEEMFETLPALDDIPAPMLPSETWAETKQSQGNGANSEPAKVESQLLPTAKSKNKARATANLSVRVDLSRLERMNNFLGELSISRNSVALQNEQLQNSVQQLLSRFDLFQNLITRLQELSDQMLIARESQGNQAQTFAPLPSTFSTLTSNFDSLEMDTYDNVHSLLQQVFEDVMQLEEAVGDIDLFAKQSDKTLEQQRQTLIQLRDELMWARMLPLSEILNRFPRILRDLSAKYNKPVNLRLSGTGVLVDKAVLEKLYDPLLHLLRNAFDHGIEPPEVRQSNGKPQEGEIVIRAYHKGNQTFIEVQDDGRGLNLERIKEKLLAQQLLSATQLAAMPDERILELIFEPGFSTALKVSELSGRGVGLDVVRSQLRELKGTVNVSSTPGTGTVFTLRLPLTLTIAKLLVALTGSTAVAIPADSIEEIIIPKASQLQKSGNQNFLRWRDNIVPTYNLDSLLQYNYQLPKVAPGKALAALAAPKDWLLPLLIIRQEQNLLALEIERLVTEQELVIKPFGEAIPAPSYTYGCTILGDGSLVPVIDGGALIDYIGEQGQIASEVMSEARIGSPESDTEADDAISPEAEIASIIPKISSSEIAQATTVLAVDDSAALRRTLVLTLEKAGYRVLQARNGQEAMEQLQQGSQVNLVICDIEMPVMNGFEFLGQRRRYPSLSKIPVAMLTSRSNDKHKRLAMQLGANAYFSKPYIEQEFLESLKDILSRS